MGFQDILLSFGVLTLWNGFLFLQMRREKKKQENAE